MFNPLVDNFESLSDDQVDEKIRKLTSHYYQTINPSVRNQIVTLLEMYQVEASVRRQTRYQQRDGDDDLDNLINVS
jgi:hypothetical protein